MIKIYTDGSYRSSEDMGGYGVAAFDDKNELIYAYQEQIEHTTNNRMELSAIINACRYIEENLIPAEDDFIIDNIIIYSDSSYCVQSINLWMHYWARNNWINSKQEKVRNIDLMETLYYYFTKIFSKNQVEVKHIKGHAGDVGNELVDALATKNKKKFLQTIEQNHIQIKMA